MQLSVGERARQYTHGGMPLIERAAPLPTKSYVS